MPAHVPGGFPPAVLTRYTSSKSPVAPSLVNSLSQGTAPKPVLSCPTGAPAGAGTVAFFEQGAKPKSIAVVSRSNVGVVVFEK